MSKRRGKAQARTDAWEHPYAGLAKSDKVRRLRPAISPTLDRYTLAALFRHDAIAARGVVLIVHEALRQGLAFVDQGQGATVADAERLNKACDRWGVVGRLKLADIWGRLFGRGAIWLGIDGAGQQGDVLVDERVRRGGLKFLRVLDESEFQPARYYSDPEHPKWGEPSHWRVMATGGGGVGSLNLFVHESRLLLFGGAELPRDEWIRNGCRDDSVLQRPYDVLQRLVVNLKSAADLMVDASQGVFAVKNLLAILSSDDGTFETRMQLMEQTRSAANAILVDADDEDFKRVATPFAGIPEMIDRAWEDTAAAFGMPVTKLKGMAPAGMNATGESDENNWNSEVIHHQTDVLLPRADRLGRIIAASEGIAGVASLSVSFPPLRHETPGQQADTRLKHAQADAQWITSGVLLPSEVALSRFGRGKFSPDITIDAKLREVEQKAAMMDPAELDDGDTTDPAASDSVAGGAKLQLTSSDLAIVVTVNEARASVGLGPIKDGDLTVAAYKAKNEGIVAAAALAEQGKSASDRPAQPQQKALPPAQGNPPTPPPVDQPKPGDGG